MARLKHATAAALLLLAANTALAQKAPELGYVYPPAVRAGTKSTVQLGGYDFTPDMQFFVHDPRVKLTVLGPPGEFFVPEPPYWFGPKGGTTAFPLPREIPARIEAPARHPPGLVRWQVAGASGSSAAAVFYVSDGPETVENRYRNQPQTLATLPIGVSGRIRKIAEVDRYQFVAKRDGPVTVELFARRLGANFNGVIQVRDDTGRLLADVADTEGLDTALTFVVKTNERYVISLHDVDFRGNRAFVYRLALTPGPRVVTTLPAAGGRGETREMEFVGYGVATGSAKLETIKRKVEFPSEAASRTLRYRLQTPFGTAPAIEIPVRRPSRPTEPVARSSETPDVLDITARLGPSGKGVHRWQAKKGQVWNITVQSRSIGTRLDPSLVIHDMAGKQLAANDDLPGTPDAGLSFTVPADGTYTCTVNDVSGRKADLASVYQLTIAAAEPLFSLSCPQQVNLPIAGKAQLALKVTREAGFQGEIALAIEGLPAGVTVPNDLKVPAKKNALPIPLQAAKDAASRSVMIRILGRAKIGDAVVTRTASSPAGGNLCPRDPRDNHVATVLLTTTMKPPFSLDLVDKNRQRAVHRGTTYPAPFIIKRDEGFNGPVQLMMAARQSRHRQGIRGPIVTVPGGTHRAQYPCFLPEWLETDRTTRMVVMAVAQVADPQGNVRYVTNPANARVTMILEGALLKVAHRTKELTTRPGESFEIPVNVARSAKLSTLVTLELVAPRELAGLVKCNRVSLRPDQSQATLHVATSGGKRLIGRWSFQVIATALQDGTWPCISQTNVPVTIENGR